MPTALTRRGVVVLLAVLTGCGTAPTAHYQNKSYGRSSETPAPNR